MKYLQGDLLKVNNQIVKVDSVEVYLITRNQYVEAHAISGSNKNILRYNIDEMRPIDLTSEILIANGWKLIDEDKAAGLNKFYFHTNHVFLTPYKDKFIYHSETTIKYVHELQHLLFGLKKNSTIML